MRRSLLSPDAAARTFDAEDVALTPAPLVYADLMATGDGRCIETAKLIYDQTFR